MRWYNNILVLVGNGYNNIWVRGLCMCEYAGFDTGFFARGGGGGGK